MSFIPQSSLFLGIIPALILLYISLKDWHNHYTEKTLFIMFILGIILGFLIILVQLSMFYDIILIVLIFPFLEQIVKTMVLNLRRFQDEQAIVLYGLGLGLGFGSIYPPALLILISQNEVSSFILISVLFGSLGLLCIHGVTGALIGYGIYQGKLVKFYVYAVLILIAAYLLLWVQVGFVQWLALIMGLIFFYVIHQKILRRMIEDFKFDRNQANTSDET